MLQLSEYHNFGANFRKSRFYVKITKNLDFGQNFRKISIWSMF